MGRNAARLQKREIGAAIDPLDRLCLQVRLKEFALCRERDAAGVVPHRLDVRVLVAGVRQGEDRLGGTELRVSEVGCGLNRMHHGDARARPRLG